MALFTLYNIVSPRPPSHFQAQLGDPLDALGLSAAETFEREDGSKLFRLVGGELELGLWVVPLQKDQFQPAPFDERGGDPGWVASIRTVCKVGAAKSERPLEVVRAALAVSAALAEGGRVYDLHAGEALEAEEAKAIAEVPFDIRRFVTYHYLAPPSGEAEHSWLHLHGMAKFFSPDLEAFDVHPDVSHKALALLMYLAEASAQGSPVPPSEPQPYGYGRYLLRPSEQVRPGLEHFSAEDFAPDHQTPSLVVEDAGAFGSLDKLLRGAYELEPKTREECRAEQRVWQARLESIRRVHQRTPLIVRAALEVGPEKTIEHIWVEIEGWVGATIKGKLLNDAFGDPKMARGTEVTFNERLISGVSVRDGEVVLDEVESLRALQPSAAEGLDQALAPPASDRRVEESASPTGAALARFEDDGVVGALHLLSADGARALIEPLWLYNRRPTPPIIDMRRPSQLGRPPLLSEVYTRQEGRGDGPTAAEVTFRWEGERVELRLDGERWAVADLTEGRGWCKLIELASRYGRPLAEREA